MDSKTRVSLAFNLEMADRPPILGGWLAVPEYIQRLTGCTEDDYWADIPRWSVAAESVLGSDGVTGVTIPAERGGYRIVNKEMFDHRTTSTLQTFINYIHSLPTLEEQQSIFDEEKEYKLFKDEHNVIQKHCAEMLYAPANWFIVPRSFLYEDFGYEPVFTTLARYPDDFRRLIRFNAETGRQRATLHARAIKEGLLPSVILTGEDFCGQNGPMVSPKFLRREYFPWFEYTFEPLLSIGVRLVWHCDGNWTSLMPDLFALGIAGFQGFQEECGLTLEWLVQQRTKNGDPLVIYGPMSVTTTLPFGTPEDVRAQVKRAMDLCRDKASLVFFTSNTILPDTPYENLLTYWQAVQDAVW
jgi:hypothetical protein